MKSKFPTLLLAALLATPASAQEPQLPAELQLPLLINVLSFDRKLAVDEDVAVAFVYQSTVPASLRERDAWLAAAREPTLLGRNKVRVIAVEYRDTDELLSELQRLAIDVAFVSPFRSVDTGALIERLRANGIRTATGSAPLAGRDVAIGLVLRAGRPRILINMPLALREGCDFSAQLLRVAEVTR